MHDRSGLIELPRFKIENEYDLKKPLTSLGVRQAFAPNKANFGQIGGANLYIGEVKQKDYVDVNEEGTVAAAAHLLGSQWD